MCKYRDYITKMSKRTFFPQQSGERKKAKLDVTISDHNFPLSQNGPKKDQEDNWGDDNDDEILLLASQACEDAYNDIGSLPDYSVCMQPGSTSTQMFDPGPSTSSANFTFKKPSAVPSKLVSTDLKDKCNRISSPLPGISSKMISKTNEVDLNLIFNDKIYKHQDSDQIYKHLLQLQEENAKLKSENGKLLDKCVTKEGEASILRTQLKSCQMAVDSARMEKIKAQEKVQTEWTEKLSTANGQMHDLRTQLDFKNLEIISIKERCRMLESNKVKLTQVHVNDIASSHRNNSILANDYRAPQRKVAMTSNSVQTDDKSCFLKLNKTWRSDPSKLTPILPLVLEPTEEQHSILEYNEKLQKHTDLSHNKCRIYSTFHRLPSTPACRENRSVKVVVNCIYEDLTNIAASSDEVNSFNKILKTVKAVLEEAGSQLEQISQKMTTAFQKEMDEKYIDATAAYLVVREMDLMGGGPLFKEEQAILARRMTAVLAYLLKTCTNELSKNYEEECSQFIDLIQRICVLLDSTSCATLHSGLLLSLTKLMEHTKHSTQKLTQILKTIISSRPMHFVSLHVLKLMRKMSLERDFLSQLCPRGGGGNLKRDYDQGVLLYKKDSCHLQILYKQIEAALKCIEKQRLVEQAVDSTRDLIALHINVDEWNTPTNQNRAAGCDCQLVSLQVIVYALRICVIMWKNAEYHNVDAATSKTLLSCCRGGTRLLYGAGLRGEGGAQPGHCAGLLLELCDVMRLRDHGESYANMLSELSHPFLPSPEDGPCSEQHRPPWLRSFDTFSVAD